MLAVCQRVRMARQSDRLDTLLHNEVSDVPLMTYPAVQHAIERFFFPLISW